MNRVYDNCGNSYTEEEFLEAALKYIKNYVSEDEDDESVEYNEGLMESVPSAVSAIFELNREVTEEDVQSFKSNKKNSCYLKDAFEILYIQFFWDDENDLDFWNKKITDSSFVEKENKKESDTQVISIEKLIELANLDFLR